MFCLAVSVQTSSTSALFFAKCATFIVHGLLILDAPAFTSIQELLEVAGGAESSKIVAELDPSAKKSNKFKPSSSAITTTLNLNAEVHMAGWCKCYGWTAFGVITRCVI